MTQLGIVTTLSAPPEAKGALNYRAFEHPALRNDAQDELVVSYMRYLELSDATPPKVRFETRLMDVKLE